MKRRDVLISALCLVALPAASRTTSPPHGPLAAVQGAWRGKLTYRDYSRPDRMVTLPTQLFVALSAPSELTLHYVFDDGPGKTVYSYERMAFDFANDLLAWSSGHANVKTSRNRITSTQVLEGGLAIAFEREDGGIVSRYAMNLHPRNLSLAQEEGTPAAGFQFRNKYEFTRNAP